MKIGNVGGKQETKNRAGIPGGTRESWGTQCALLRWCRLELAG